ncbi:MAG: FAD-binding protein, partial [Burkholderiales bacterium]|nr:FAD-binding protein [Burkholderiales bacterium]
GTVHQKAFAGQTFDRTVHKGDQTGIEIINRLAEQVWARKIERMEEHRAIALIPNAAGDALAGVLMIDVRSGGYVFVQAKAVLLATGGGPTMYKFHTPSGDKSCDGLSMALDAGLALRDMEMVQFHPTGLLAGTGTRMTGTVLEEGLRGSGGYLLNGAGERFMHAYDSRGERATRDIVSRSIFSEMRAGRTSPNGGVFIEMKHLGVDNVRNSFKGMVDRCADCGFDLAGGRVEVVPTAHYMMGGVVFDGDCRTSLPGLFAAGEDTGGVHGANRLGGNGVANSTVYGGIAGDAMAMWVRRDGHWHAPDEALIQQQVGAHDAPLQRKHSSTEALREALYDLMWNDAGILRTKAGLQRAQSELLALNEEIERVGVSADDRAFNLSWHDWLNLRSLIRVSQAITTAALAREDSRGAHFREDFPLTGELETSRYTVVRKRGEALELTEQPVAFTRVRPGETLIT